MVMRVGCEHAPNSTACLLLCFHRWSYPARVTVATELARPAVRVVHMEAGVGAADVRSQLRGGLASGVLLDSKGGGTGKTFDWCAAVSARPSSCPHALTYLTLHPHTPNTTPSHP